MINLTGRVAGVTEAGPNIDRAIAVPLARAGNYIFCNDVDRRLRKARQRRSRMQAGGGAIAIRHY
jgi:NAD(P)-dependent dehydrogenase (short-subunit alcohol dehydrogenase family)